MGTIIYAERFAGDSKMQHDASQFLFTPNSHWRRPHFNPANPQAARPWTWTDSNPLDQGDSAGLQQTVEFKLNVVDLQALVQLILFPIASSRLLTRRRHGGAYSHRWNHRGSQQDPTRSSRHCRLTATLGLSGLPRKQGPATGGRWYRRTGNASCNYAVQVSDWRFWPHSTWYAERREKNPNLIQLGHFLRFFGDSKPETDIPPSCQCFTRWFSYSSPTPTPTRSVYSDTITTL